MRTSTLVLVVVALCSVGAGLYLSNSPRRDEAVSEFVGSRGLGERAQAVAEADAKLTEQVTRKLGLSDAPEREIDFANPTEADLRFLLDTFQNGDPGARRSAARALILVQEPRAVGLFARFEGTPEDEGFFCDGAQEILRFKTREEAVSLMIDLLEDREHPPRKVCRTELEQKFRFIRGDSPEVLQELVNHPSPRVRRYVLEHLPPSADPELRKAIATLQTDRDETIAELARRWSEQPVSSSPSIPSEQPGPGSDLPSGANVEKSGDER